MPNKKVPFFDELKSYLIDIRDEYKKLGQNKDTGELDLPEIIPGRAKTVYGTYQRKAPQTYSQAMASYAEILNVVISNIDLLKLRTKKTDLERQILEADDFYKASINRINEELEEARKTEAEMRNRFLSAYEMNAPYVQELKKNGLDNKEEINRIIPIDEFKAAWEEASRRLSKLQNAKVETENAYEEASNKLISEYKNNERQLKDNSDSIANADAAWDNIIDSITLLEQNDKVRNLTEKELEKAPAEGKMSNYDMWRLQSDLSTFKNSLLALEENVAYNEHYKGIEKVNNIFENFKDFVADEFDSEYENVRLEGENGIYAQLDTDEMKKAAEFKSKLREDAIAAGKSDVQEGPVNDDYGILLRTAKADDKKLNQLLKDKADIQKAIENNNKKIKDQEAHRDEMQNVLNNWKNPELKEHKDLKPAEDEIAEANRKLTIHNQKIKNKQADIQKQKNVIEKDIPLKIEGLNKDSRIQINNLRKIQDELKKFDQQVEKFDNEYNAELSVDEFKDINTDKWLEEYIKLSPDVSGIAVQKIFDDGLKVATEIGLEIAEDRHNIKKLEDKFQALSKFRKAAESEGIKNVALFNNEYEDAQKALKEKYEKERKEIISDYNKRIDGLQTESVIKSIQDNNPKKYAIEDVKDPVLTPDLLELDDEDEDPLENDEYLEEKELFDNSLTEWKELIRKQEDAIFNYAQQIEQKNIDAENAYAKAIEDAENTLRNKEDEIENLYNKREKALKALVKPNDLAHFEENLEIKEERIAHQIEKREEFLNGQKEATEEFENELARQLNQKDIDHEDEIQREQEEYDRLTEKVEAELLLNELDNSNLPLLYEELGLKQRQVAHYKQFVVSSDKKGELSPSAKQLDDDYQSKIDQLNKDIDNLNKRINVEISSKEDNFQEIYKQTIGNSMIVKGQIEYLKEKYAQERLDYENQARQNFKLDQEKELADFDLEQKKELEEYDRVSFPNYINITKDLEKLALAKEKDLNDARTEYNKQSDIAWKERSKVQNQLAMNSVDDLKIVRERIDKQSEEFYGLDEYKKYRDSLPKDESLVVESFEDLLIKQQAERDEFMAQREIASNNEHEVIYRLLSSYQKRRVEMIPQYVGEGKKEREEELAKKGSEIQRLKKEKGEELAYLENRYNEDLQNIIIDGPIDKDHEISILSGRAQDKLSGNIARLNRLNAERTSLPNSIKLTERLYNDAMNALDKAKQDRNNEIAQGEADYLKNKQQIENYKNKDIYFEFNNQKIKVPGNIIENVEKHRAAFALVDLLKADIEAFKEKGLKHQKSEIEAISDSREGKPITPNEAYAFGKSVHDMLLERAQEEVNHKFEGLSAKEKAQAEADAFYEAEREFLFTTNDEGRTQYEFFNSVDQNREAFLGIMGYSEDQLDEFNKRIMQSSQRQYFEQAGLKSSSDVMVDPENLLNEITLNDTAYLNNADGLLNAFVAVEYNKAERAKDEEAIKQQKAVYNQQIETIDKEIRGFKFDNLKLDEAIKQAKDKIKDIKEAQIGVIDSRLPLMNDEIVSLNKEIARIKENKEKLNKADKNKLLKEKNSALKAKTKEKSNQEAAKNKLLKEIPTIEAAIKKNEALIKKNEDLIKSKETQKQAIGPFVPKPKAKKTEKQLNAENETINSLVDKLSLKIRDPKAYKAIDEVYKYNHKMEPIKHKWAVSITACERRVKRYQADLDSLKEAQRTNESNILECHNNILKYTGEVEKYKLYNRGYSLEYTDVEKALNDAKVKLKADEQKQLDKNAEQLKLQTEIKSKLKPEDNNIFANAGNLLKKHRLVKYTLKKNQDTLALENKHMDELVRIEKMAMDEYLKLDQGSEILDSLSNLTTLDDINKATDDLANQRLINKNEQQEKQNAIHNIEKQIEDLGSAQYSNDADREQAVKDISKKQEDLEKYYSEMHELEDKATKFDTIEKAHVILKARNRIEDQTRVINEREVVISQIKSALRSVEDEIKDYKEVLNKKHDLISERVKKNENLVKSYNDKVALITVDETAKEKDKLQQLENELKELESGEEIQQLNKEMNDAQMHKTSLVNDNAQIDKENNALMASDGIGGTKYKRVEGNINETTKQISNIENTVRTDTQRLSVKENEIKQEEERMRQEVRSKRQQLGKDVLNLDKYNKLSRQKEKIEDFQRRRLVPMINQEYKTVAQVDENSKQSIVNVNNELKRRMSDIEKMSKTVKKMRILSDSKQFTDMITAVRACANMDVNTDPAAAIQKLIDAAGYARTYIEKRNTDWVKTSSLLRKNRLDLARDIIRTSRMMSRQYEKFANDKTKNQQAIETYNTNRENAILIKSSENEQKGSYEKFSDIYIKPVADIKKNADNQHKYFKYRTRDERFQSYTKNIYTKQWDKLEKELENNYQKNLDEIKVDNKVKLSWGPNSYVNRNLKFTYDKDFKDDRKVMVVNQDDNGNFAETMIGEIHDYNLEHVIKEQTGDVYVSYEYKMDDTNYNSINIAQEKAAFDLQLKNEVKQKAEEFKLVVEPKNPKLDVSDKHKKFDLDDELPGLKNDKPVQNKERKSPDEGFVKEENKNGLII